MPIEEEATNQVDNHKQVLVTTESQPLNVKLHLDSMSQNEENAHSDSQISTHDRDVELPKINMHSDSEVERPNIETRTEPRLSKYVRRHHPTKQII